MKPKPAPVDTYGVMRIRSTTILAVRRDGKLAIAGDGQVTFDKTVMKHSARKVRRIANGTVVVGLRRQRRRRDHAPREVRGQARGVQGQPDARRGRTREGLAPRSRLAPPGSFADRGERGAPVRDQRERRRDRARRGDRRDRERRPVRAGGGAGACCGTARSTRRRSRAPRSRSQRRSASTRTTTSPWRCAR